ncbi:actin family [Umbelopsis sp. PMI_123]|nr:actin family [Umbelopsis sp. PMI_123]
MVTYGGDEVNALVLDIGSTWTRAGYAGEDTPKAIFPTSYGVIESESTDPNPQNGHDQTEQADPDTEMTDARTPNGDAAAKAEDAASSGPKKVRKYYIGDGEVNIWRENMEIKNPLKDGLVEDWEGLEEIWKSAFHQRLRIDPTEHPLLCTEPAWNPSDKREKLVELAFEKFNFPAFYLAKDAVMSAFSVGRATALVLDSGGSTTSAIPVYDGLVLKRGILRQPIGGNVVSTQIMEELKRSLDYTVSPQYLIAEKEATDPGQPPKFRSKDRPNTTDSYHHFQQERAIHEYKETICQVAETPYDEELLAARPQKPFEFPDGFNSSVGIERFRATELLFQPRSYLTKPGTEGAFGSTFTQQQIDASLGIHQLIFNSICGCDIDLRPLLFNNVVVTGGNTLFPGFVERLNYELPGLAPGSKIKIHAAGTSTDRRCSSWLGGSILASLGTFHQLWISKAEYEESGASIVESKCF